MSDDTWKRVCLLGASALTLGRWRQELRGVFPVCRRWIEKTGRPVGHVKRGQCACNHRVVPNLDGDGFVAVCTCGAGGEPVAMTEAKARAWVLNGRAVVKEMAAALPVEVCVKAVGRHLLWEIGTGWTLAGQRRRVLVSLAGKRAVLEAGLGDIFTHGMKDFLLLVSDPAWCGSDLGPRLEPSNGEVHALGRFVEFGRAGMTRGPLVARILGDGPAGAGRGGAKVLPVGGRHVIARGANSWRVVFDGVEVPGIGKDRGMFFVAYLAGHAGAEPMHALELEAKGSHFYRKECGLTEIVDPDSEAVVPVGIDAVLMERDLNLDKGRMAELLGVEERKALAVVENPRANAAARAVALKKVDAIRAYRVNQFGKNSSPATDAVRRVRIAIDRLVTTLQAMKPGDPGQSRAVAGFAGYVQQHIRNASARLWPKAGLRGQHSGWQPGHFVCQKVDGIDWIVK
jgi:hypothetical protein